MDSWTEVPWYGPEPQPRNDERRDSAPASKARCAVCETPLPRQYPGHVTCPSDRARCRYILAAKEAGAVLPNSPTPMVKRPDPSHPEMLVVVPSLAEVAAQVAA